MTEPHQPDLADLPDDDAVGEDAVAEPTPGERPDLEPRSS
jgi:hypothetical protein